MTTISTVDASPPPLGPSLSNEALIDQLIAGRQNAVGQLQRRVGRCRCARWVSDRAHPADQGRGRKNQTNGGHWTFFKPHPIGSATRGRDPAVQCRDRDTEILGHVSTLRRIERHTT
jgi:hypothetical protein